VGDEPPGPSRFGPFVVERVIGSGATAEVWRARHETTDVLVAVKIVADPAWTGDEVRVAAGLLHPHLTPVYDLGRGDDGRGWVAMELATGGTVAEWRPGRWRDVVRVLTAALSGLASLHAARLVHRDVKRANLLRFLDPGDPRAAGWTVKLGDFGIAVGPHDVTVRAGSPETIAPEQIRGERGELGPWTDLYALGIVAHQLVCGTVPFQRVGRDLLAAHLGDRPVFGTPALPVPPGLFGWIGTLLRKDPATRYQRAADALADLLALGDEGRTDVVPLRPRRASPARSSGTPPRRRRSRSGPVGRRGPDHRPCGPPGRWCGRRGARPTATPGSRWSPTAAGRSSARRPSAARCGTSCARPSAAGRPGWWR
jgi:serine/threonine protein kinase